MKKTLTMKSYCQNSGNIKIWPDNKYFKLSILLNKHWTKNTLDYTIFRPYLYGTK